MMAMLRHFTDEPHDMDTIPNTGNMPFIRTDFTNDAVWNEVVKRAGRPTVEGFKAHLQIIDQPTFDRLSAQDLCALAAGTHHSAIFVADETTMTASERHVLCVDLRWTGRSFRIVPEELWGVENNLTIANMD